LQLPLADPSSPFAFLFVCLFVCFPPTSLDALKVRLGVEAAAGNGHVATLTWLVDAFELVADGLRAPRVTDGAHPHCPGGHRLSAVALTLIASLSFFLFFFNNFRVCVCVSIKLNLNWFRVVGRRRPLCVVCVVSLTQRDLPTVGLRRRYRPHEHPLFPALLTHISSIVFQLCSPTSLQLCSSAGRCRWQRALGLRAVDAATVQVWCE
jgi:hypothetical protein